MKTLLILLCSIGLLRAETKYAEREYFNTNGAFVLKFKYDDSISSVPLTLPLGQPHYMAEVTVFQKHGTTLSQIGSPFDNNFTERGCFEDEPEYLISRAKNSKPQTREHTMLFGTNIVITNPPRRFSYATNALNLSNLFHGASRYEITNHINWLVDSGKFCEVRGHSWQNYASNSYGAMITGEWRTCSTCKSTHQKVWLKVP